MRQMASFLETAPLIGLADLRRNKRQLPEERGLYGFFFSTPPGIATTQGCYERDGRWLMYIGSAGATLHFDGNLRKRLGKNHLGGNERGSTICETLAALMPEMVGPAIIKFEKGKPKNHTSLLGKVKLKHWMDENIAVCWTTNPRPGDVEEGLVRQFAPSLNLDFSAHPFSARLSGLRKARGDLARAEEA